MQFYLLEPEVAGGWSEGTIVTNRDALDAGREIFPLVDQLHYRFDGWFGDDILAFISTLIVTARLADAMRAGELTGLTFATVTTITSDMWDQIHPDNSVLLPEFERLIPTGRVDLKNQSVVSWSGHDVCWGFQRHWQKPEGPLLSSASAPYALVVTAHAMEILRVFQLANCGISELTVS